MNQAQLVVMRLQAHALGRAVPTRGSFELGLDPVQAVGVATIKIVTEEQVQALAFGDFAGPPQVIARIDPMGRDASDLEPFAEWLIVTFARAQETDEVPRIWLPHSQTLETLDVLGHRYERNRSASEMLRKMGAILRIIAREQRHRGQQSVAVASKLLLDHVATGQSPAEDGHLGALLAWIEPPLGSSPTELAARRAIEPAGGVLANHPARRDDDRIELLRRDWKKANGPRRAALEAEIEAILGRAVLDEWTLLVDARRAFWGLGLESGALDECIEESKRRVFRALEVGAIVPRNAVPRIREMLALEHSQELIEDARLLSDPVLRAQARRKGRVLYGRIALVQQTTPGQRPCIVTVASPQRDLRFRRDESIAAIGTKIVAKVVDIAFDEPSGGSIVRLAVTSGVRSERARLVVGREFEWMRHSGFPYVKKRAALDGLQTPWMFDAGALVPVLTPARALAPDLIGVAQRHLGKTS
jgi:hypothetical protein